MTHGVICCLTEHLKPVIAFDRCQLGYCYQRHLLPEGQHPQRERGTYVQSPVITCPSSGRWIWDSVGVQELLVYIILLPFCVYLTILRKTRQQRSLYQLFMNPKWMFSLTHSLTWPFLSLSLCSWRFCHLLSSWQVFVVKYFCQHLYLFGLSEIWFEWPCQFT